MPAVIIDWLLINNRTLGRNGFKSSMERFNYSEHSLRSWAFRLTLPRRWWWHNCPPGREPAGSWSCGWRPPVAPPWWSCRSWPPPRRWPRTAGCLTSGYQTLLLWRWSIALQGSSSIRYMVNDEHRCLLKECMVTINYILYVQVCIEEQRYESPWTFQLRSLLQSPGRQDKVPPLSAPCLRTGKWQWWREGWSGSHWTEGKKQLKKRWRSKLEASGNRANCKETQIYESAKPTAKKLYSN